MSQDRRSFLKLAGAGLSAATLAALDKAMATPAQNRTGTIMDVEHVVIFMQENRAFDHYFGQFPGVRGHGDPRPLRLSNGKPVWFQASDEHRDGHVLPYWADSKTKNAYVVDGAHQGHDWATKIVNGGRYDGWGLSKQLKNRMTYYKASDLPFYHALAERFTLLDAYHCSTLTQTYPHRLHLWTGCNGGGTVGGDPVMSNYGEDETPSADMAEDRPITPYEWTTYAERLEAAGISWKIYQEYDNFGDNILSVFKPFRPCDRKSNLYKRGRAWVSEHKSGPDRTRSDGDQLVEAFTKDIKSKTLPQVSWIVSATALSEHPTSLPADGENLCAKLIQALVDNPEVYAKTVFIINYDEAGGFFDHMLPPMPPANRDEGYSGIDVSGEFKDYDLHPKRHIRGKQPLGLGIRVPALIVSPWTRGGYVCSDVFDHTSTLRFLEQRFGVKEPNISPWRRAICGDLTSAFDFKTPNAPLKTLNLPSTADYQERVRHSKAQPGLSIPEQQGPSDQPQAWRKARPLAYRFSASLVHTAQGVEVLLKNQGGRAAVLTVHDYGPDNHAPWRHSLNPGQSYQANEWNHPDLDDYALSIHGPNGFYRGFKGTRDRERDPYFSALHLELHEDPKKGQVELKLQNQAEVALDLVLSYDARYPLPSGQPQQTALKLGAKSSQSLFLNLTPSGNWYDFTITCLHTSAWSQRFAGHMENGLSSITDPGIGVMVLD